MGIGKTLATVIGAGALALCGASEEAKADLIHTQLGAYTVFEDNFNDGNYDGWTIYSGGADASEGFLKGIDGNYLQFGLDNFNLPSKYELQFRANTNLGTYWPNLAFTNLITAEVEGSTGWVETPDKIPIALTYLTQNRNFILGSTSSGESLSGTEPGRIDPLTWWGDESSQNGLWYDTSLVKTEDSYEYYLAGYLMGSVKSGQEKEFLSHIAFGASPGDRFGLDDVKIWTTEPQSQPVPEPSGLEILTGSLIGLGMRKKRI